MESVDLEAFRLIPRPPESTLFPHCEEMFDLIRDMVEASIDNNPKKGDDTLTKMLQFLMHVTDPTYPVPTESPSGARLVSAGYVQLPRNANEASSMIRVGMHYLENNASELQKSNSTAPPESSGDNSS